jgi:hypothetical protein
MLVPVEMLIDGVVRTLTEAVAPHVGARFARGQLYAAIDVLRNLRDRVEERAARAEAEAASAADGLRRVVAALREPAAAAAAAVEKTLAAAPEGPPAERAAALRRAVVAALEVLDALPAEVAAGARAALEAHLAAQALRDLAVLKPSLLAEISRG